MECPIQSRSTRLRNRALLAGLHLIKAPSCIPIKGLRAQSSIAMLHRMAKKVASPVLALLLQSQGDNSSSDEPSENPLTCRRWSRPYVCLLSA